MTHSQTTRELKIELLALDLDTCTRCTGTLENIETALEAVRGAMEATCRRSSGSAALWS